MEDPVEFQERLLVKRDVIQVADFDAAFAEAVFDGLGGEGGIVFFAREPFLLGGGDNLAIANQARGAVVVKSRKAEDVHPLLIAYFAAGNNP